jgi:phage tail sheath gpL-like
MAISFNNISSNLRIPLVFGEVSNEKAGYFVQNSRAILIGQSVTAITEEPTLIQSIDHAKSLYGTGSMLARMVESFRQNNDFSELWVLPLNDVGGATAATRTITYTGTLTSSGTIVLYLGGEVVSVPVVSGDSVTTIASATAAAITAAKDAPFTATSALGVVTITAKNKGTLGSAIPVFHNFRGKLANEITPTGITVAISAASGGATDPTISSKLSLLGDQDFMYFGHPYADTSSIGAFTSLLNDTTGRWSPLKAQYGHVWTCKADTSSALVTLGNSLNDQHHTLFGYETGIPNSAEQVVGAILGRVANALSIDPARTVQTLELNGIVAPKEKDRFSASTRNTLLWNGVATLKHNVSAVQIERSATTYQKNSYNQADPSYLDVETMTTLAYMQKALSYRFTQKFPRMKLAANDTKFGFGQSIVTPKDLFAELVAQYAEWEQQGLVQEMKKFKSASIVELDGNDPNRVNILFAPYLVNNLRVIAIKTEFRLNVGA